MFINKYLFIIFSVLFLLTSTQTGRASAGLEDYGIDDLPNVIMSYRYDGAYSPFKYVQVRVEGPDKTICSFQYFNQAEQIAEVYLDKNFLKDLIRHYTALDFFNYDFNKITESSDENHIIEDAGRTTFSYHYKDKARKISYEIIKTKTQGHLAIPINDNAKKLLGLQNMYWQIINLQIYKDKLKNYQKLDKGTLANELSSLAQDAERKEILNSKELVPLVMEIISQGEFRDSIGQYAASALKEITQEHIPGDWWDCQKWLKWWEVNKSSYEKN